MAPRIKKKKLPAKKSVRPRYRYLKQGEVASRHTDEVNYHASIHLGISAYWAPVKGYDGFIVTEHEAKAKTFRRRISSTKRR